MLHGTGGGGAGRGGAGVLAYEAEQARTFRPNVCMRSGAKTDKSTTKKSHLHRRRYREAQLLAVRCRLPNRRVPHALRRRTSCAVRSVRTACRTWMAGAKGAFYTRHTQPSPNQRSPRALSHSARPLTSSPT